MQAKAQQVIVTNAAQVADLPFAGNFASDSHLFQAVHAYAENPATPREEARLAFYNLSKFGMGIDEPVTDEALDMILAEAHEQ